MLDAGLDPREEMFFGDQLAGWPRLAFGRFFKALLKILGCYVVLYRILEQLQVKEFLFFVLFVL